VAVKQTARIVAACHFTSVQAFMIRLRVRRRARLLSTLLAHCLCAMTFAGCAPDTAKHDLTASDNAPPEQAEQSRQAKLSEPIRPRRIASRDVQVTNSAEPRSKGRTERPSLESKTTMPLPDSQLLDPPPEPHCELEAPDVKADNPRNSITRSSATETRKSPPAAAYCCCKGPLTR
jgi:hypothetical protein